jgi:uncharacterized BrkB/YihY/UPF0761 family membrane protein
VPSGILPKSVFFMGAAYAVAAVARITLKVNVALNIIWKKNRRHCPIFGFFLLSVRYVLCILVYFAFAITISVIE